MGRDNYSRHSNRHVYAAYIATFKCHDDEHSSMIVTETSTREMDGRLVETKMAIMKALEETVDEGIIQMCLKDKPGVHPSLASQALRELLAYGSVKKEMAKIPDGKGKFIITNLIKIAKKA